MKPCIIFTRGQHPIARCIKDVEEGLIGYLRIRSEDFFQTLQDLKGQQLDKNHLSVVSKNSFIWTKWAILGQLWPKIMQAYI